MKFYASPFNSSICHGIVRATEVGICEVHFSTDVAREAFSDDELPSEITERAAVMLNEYFKGCSQQFEILPVDLFVKGKFRRRVLECIRAIPYREVLTYGQVASIVGSPGSARAVGGAMAVNPIPVIIPCHRVVGAGGRLTGYSAPGGIAFKEYLLKMEGFSQVS